MPLKLCKKTLGCQQNPQPARGSVLWPLPSHSVVMGIMPARCGHPNLLALNALAVSHLPSQGMSASCRPAPKCTPAAQCCHKWLLHECKGTHRLHHHQQDNELLWRNLLVSCGRKTCRARHKQLPTTDSAMFLCQAGGEVSDLWEKCTLTSRSSSIKISVRWIWNRIKKRSGL